MRRERECYLLIRKIRAAASWNIIDERVRWCCPLIDGP
jgi:hypothetical protein